MSQVSLKDIVTSKEFSMPAISTDNASEAYEKVLRFGGCSLKEIFMMNDMFGTLLKAHIFEGSEAAPRTYR